MIYDAVIDGVSISEVISKNNDDTLTPEALSKLWTIPNDIARNTIKATSSSSIRTNEGRISRRFRTNTHQRRYIRDWVVVMHAFTLTLYFRRCKESLVKLVHSFIQIGWDWLSYILWLRRVKHINHWLHLFMKLVYLTSFTLTIKNH